MTSERLQRRIERLLDQVDEDAERRDWEAVAASARAVLAIDDRNSEAMSFLAMAEAAGEGPVPPALSNAENTARPVPNAPAVTPPDSFVGGRYRVERFLGDGGKKRVFLAHDTTLDRDVAFALLRSEGLDIVGRQRLVREAQAMARIGTHPNLVAIYDTGEVDGAPFLIEEFMAGGDVAALVADDPPPLEQTLAIASAVCDALTFIHEQQLIHRDLKPSNVFLAEDGTAKLGDFGLAVALDRTRLTQDGSMVGTASYMPPEQALGGEVTAQSDLYALGAMLYELVTGRPPFVGDDPTSVISQHINTPPVAPSWHTEHCPPDLEELILRLLQKAPQDRPESAAEVRETLSRVDPEAKSVSHSDSGANPLDRLARGVFVGREAELERLKAAFNQAFSGQGGVAMLVGEPGSGKTRTSMELETFARMRGAQVLVGRTHESEGMPSYWPWVEIGNAWVAAGGDFPGLSLDPGASSELLRIFPGLRQLAPNVAEPEAVTDPESAQFRLFDAYTSFIRAVAAEQPLLLVLDDLHWADKPSLMLLQHLSRSLSRMRVLVVGTYRDTDITRQSALSETLASLNREGGIERVLLRGLSRDEVGSYIAATAHIEPAPALVARIHEETEGNPFFLSEVVNLMTQEGTLSTDSVSDIALPEGVKEALGRRLDRISEEASELLQVAAVAGREFRYEDLAALGDHGEDELLSLVEEGLAARVIEESGAAGQYRFTHALMQETLLGELSTTRKVRLHGRLGEALEARWGELSDERATRLAQHFVEAATLTDRHAEKAFRYSLLAAEAAQAQMAWGEAARRYETCLTLLEDAEKSIETDTAALLAATAVCHRNSGRHGQAWKRMSAAIRLYRARGEVETAARATLEATGIQVQATEGAIVKQALADVQGRDAHLEALLHAELLRAMHRAYQEPGEIAQHRARALALAQGNDFADVLAPVAHGDMVTAEFAGEHVLAVQHGREAHRRYDSLGLTSEAADSLGRAASNALMAGLLAEAVDLAGEAREYAHRFHLRAWAMYAAGTLANGYFHQGARESAEAILDEHQEDQSSVLDLTRSSLCLVTGDIEGAVIRLPSAEPLARFPAYKAQVHAIRARVLLAAGDRESARAEFLRMEELSDPSAEETSDASQSWRNAIAPLSEAMAELASPELQRAWLESPTDGALFRLTGCPPLVRAQVALALGEDELAADELAVLEIRAEQAGAPILVGRCRQGLAEVAIRRGNRTGAMEHLDGASKLFQQYGIKLYLDQVIAKKLELHGVGSTDSGATIDLLTRSVGAERPNLAPQTAPDGTVTLLFSDIEGSTALNVELGDDAWMELLGEHNHLLRDAIAEHSGFEVKTEGDAFMVAFGSARDAVRCAQAMQSALEARNSEADRRVRIRIGLHTGEPVKEADDFYGTHVVLASRIASTADGGEILVSSLLRDLVASSGEFELTAREPVVLKGLDGEHVTYAVGWA